MAQIWRQMIMTSSRDLPWIGKPRRRARHDTYNGRGQAARRPLWDRRPPPWPDCHAHGVDADREPAPDVAPAIDDRERFLATLFLRRLVTYYARRRRFAQMGGAAVLLRSL